MTRHATTAAILTLTLFGCGEEIPGTQIGFEDEGPGCRVVSDEVITDLDAVPEGFDRSARTILDDHLGRFAGAQLDDLEQPTSDQASLEVTLATDPVRLVITEPEQGDALSDVGGVCSPALQLGIDVHLQADGIPAFTGFMDARITGDHTWSEHRGEDGFSEPLPGPATFAPDEVDIVEPGVRLSGGSGSWWVTVSWHAERHDGRGEDGGHSLIHETVMWAALDPAGEGR